MPEPLTLTTEQQSWLREQERLHAIIGLLQQEVADLRAQVATQQMRDSAVLTLMTTALSMPARVVIDAAPQFGKSRG